jgi:adenylate cyclase
MPPPEQQVTRKLAAVLAADVVGFSRLMGRDEEGTLARVTALRTQVIEPLAEQHQGRIAKVMGDGVLIAFESPVQAVRCAVAIQERLGPKTGSEPLVQLRIGVNVGDIIIDASGDIFGDGVNVAARLEQIAPPGGICISGKVYEEVRDKLRHRFDDRGERSLKNILRPVRVYEISGAVPRPEPVIAQSLDLSPPDRPSIAVLPLANMTREPAQEFFADGMTEDIITALSRLRWLFVIARNSTFAYKGQAIDVRRVARDLGVRYVLEGSVRAAGNRIRITGQLIDAERGKHIWAERYDRLLSDVFAVQDEIAENVVAAIEPHLYAEEGFRARNKPPHSIDAWGLVVSALSLINTAPERRTQRPRSCSGAPSPPTLATRERTLL